ncbi:zf-HC2 domain-containing protein, partial [Streptomyces sp. NPDC047123]|uniref:zf-HC2 domain-containing protein n=1 Tax=Streptomyces sp. NPDC047123 TaxID=3155622 RepID=UPI0033E098D4
MTSDHEAVRALLGAWALDALMPGDEAMVAMHLGDCGACAAEATRLRATVRHLDGPGPATPAHPGSATPAHPGSATPAPPGPAP